jgi:acyl-CoA synthetase (AMP-forming)/AMP-acid ligase II
MMGYATSRADLALGDEQSGLLKTGDLARRNAAGFFEITGRSSRFIKVMGSRVSLDDAEAVAKALGYTAAAVGEEDRLVLVIEGEEDSLAARAKLVEALKLPPRVLEVALVSELPRASSGKLLYARIASLLQEGARR